MRKQKAKERTKKKMKISRKETITKRKTLTMTKKKRSMKMISPERNLHINKCRTIQTNRFRVWMIITQMINSKTWERLGYQIPRCTSLRKLNWARCSRSRLLKTIDFSKN